MPGGRKGDGTDPPSAPGWYPDPWSATGDGERYYDGKRWGTTAKPLARHTTNTIDPAPAPRGVRARARSARGMRGKAVPALVILVLVAAAYEIPRLHKTHSLKFAAPVVTPSTPTTTDPQDHPPASREEQPSPIGTPAPVPAGNGKFETLLNQPGGSTTPVAWDPCRPIHYVVDPKGAPPDGAVLIQSAINRVHTATGLEFVDDGTTTEKPDKNREPYQPLRYNSTRWAPVLIAWSDENAYAELAGYIDGIGEAEPVYATRTQLVYVSGQVVLDRHDLSKTASPDRGIVEAVIRHEFGHLMGLDHTSDRTQLMFSEAQFNVRDYGSGDLRGLALLGRQTCFPDI